jgi:hypothetical protein
MDIYKLKIVNHHFGLLMIMSCLGDLVATTHFFVCMIIQMTCAIVLTLFIVTYTS